MTTTAGSKPSGLPFFDQLIERPKRWQLMTALSIFFIGLFSTVASLSDGFSSTPFTKGSWLIYSLYLFNTPSLLRMLRNYNRNRLNKNSGLDG